MGHNDIRIREEIACSGLLIVELYDTANVRPVTRPDNCMDSMNLLSFCPEFLKRHARRGYNYSAMLLVDNG